jgi:hypothetical protein
VLVQGILIDYLVRNHRKPPQYQYQLQQRYRTVISHLLDVPVGHVHHRFGHKVQGTYTLIVILKVLKNLCNSAKQWDFGFCYLDENDHFFNI